MTHDSKTDAGMSLLERAIDFICTSEFISADQAERLRKEFNEKFVIPALAAFADAPVPQCDAEPVRDLLMRLRDYLDINHRPGNDLGPKFSAEISVALAAPARCDAVTSEATERAKNALFNLARMHGYRLNDVELREAVRAVARALSSPPPAGLPKPETMLTYASILEKPQYQIDPKTGKKYLLATGEIVEAACAALRYCAALASPPPAGAPSSPPPFQASHLLGERDPSVMPDSGGGETITGTREALKHLISGHWFVGSYWGGEACRNDEATRKVKAVLSHLLVTDEAGREK